MARFLFVFAIMTAALFAQPVRAQTVDCGNGNYCPAGHACLIGGTCGFLIDAPRGATKTSTGNFCDPGYVEHKYRRGGCAPVGYAQCENGFVCPPGSTCNRTGGCDGVGTDGPLCPGQTTRCITGRLCSSKNTCYNPELLVDCGNGKSLCTKAAACEEPSGCVYVSPKRSPQIRR